MRSTCLKFVILLMACPWLTGCDPPAAQPTSTKTDPPSSGTTTAAWAATSQPTSTQTDPFINVKDFYTPNVIGHLGHPLGTIVHVTGVCIDERGFKADLGKTLLQVETVNGKRLDQPWVFEFHRAAKEITKPKPGDEFDYNAHEWGAFDGVARDPDDLNPDEMIFAHSGFHYTPEITIHKSNAAYRKR